MREYRLQPARVGGLWAGVLAALLVAFGLPALIAPQVPAPEPDHEIYIGEEEHRVPLPGCTQDSMAFFPTWNCAGTTVITQLYPVADIDDPDRTLRRTVKGALSLGDNTGPIEQAGNIRLLIDDRSPLIAFYFKEGEELFYLVIEGPGAREVTAQIWPHVADAPLPPAVDEALKTAVPHREKWELL